MKVEDLTGRIFNRLTVTSMCGVRNKKTYWTCQCACGKVISIRSDGLKSGTVKSCGCYHREVNSRCEDLTGKEFNGVAVIKVAHKAPGGMTWKCLCLCGKEFTTYGSSLKSGHTRSCGCLQRKSAAKHAKAMGEARKTHGLTNTPEYIVWHSMRQRSLTGTSTPERYLDRGITICERWVESFENFLEDMGSRPSPVHQINRKDNNGIYEPNNCHWATPKEQQRNRSSNVLIAYRGKTQCISAWAEEYGLRTAVLWVRLRKLGWPIHDALTKPVAKTATEKKKYKTLRNQGNSLIQ